MVTSNGVGAGHLIRASAIARSLQAKARPVIFSMAYSVVEVCSALGIDCEYVPSRDKNLMPKRKWDRYLRDRLIALIDETNASAHHGLGLAMLRLNNYEGALDELFTAVTYKYNFPQAHYHIGETLVKYGKKPDYLLVWADTIP